MKIVSIEVRKVRVPLSTRVVSAVGAVEHLGCLLLVVRSDEGLQGENVVFTLSDRFTTPLAHLITELGETLIGSSIVNLEENWDAMHHRLGFFGVRGFSTMAIGALDGALWDLRGKTEGRSISTMLGRKRDTVDIYDSGGLWLHMSRSELREYAETSLASGFRAMKLRLGASSLREDNARIADLAAAVDGRAVLMADANQTYNEIDAIEAGKALQYHGYRWYEEPSSQLDLRRATRIRQALDIPIAAGENCYSRFDAAELCASQSAEIFMPDLQRIGGVTEFFRSATATEVAGLTTSAHLFPEYSLQLLGALGNVSSLEYVPWFAQLFNETIELQEGRAVIPNRPGWGFTLNWRATETFA
ncbi:mandelate racemase/muconate lactonizing enzyme family protein [Brucella intermedia]|uniref:mandelate racemase/muconate lactonizing enzyme family protein n=1 Tax=Brucella intermedia TaxID=94625 RepID=UPI00224B563D|nr:mandelate racemase/muconate lactonizing enzyme family protein [Brucella intermedia]